MQSFVMKKKHKPMIIFLHLHYKKWKKTQRHKKPHPIQSTQQDNSSEHTIYNYRR